MPSQPSHEPSAQRASTADQRDQLLAASGWHGANSAGEAVESADLLQGKKAVEIKHNGAVYRLQATKLGKLILTK